MANYATVRIGDDEHWQFDGLHPIFMPAVGGRPNQVSVPVEPFFTALGYEVNTSIATQIRITKPGVELTIDINGNNFTVNRNGREPEHGHFGSSFGGANGATTIPIEAPLRALGYGVGVNSQTRTLHIIILHDFYRANNTITIMEQDGSNNVRATIQSGHLVQAVQPRRAAYQQSSNSWMLHVFIPNNSGTEWVPLSYLTPDAGVGTAFSWNQIGGTAAGSILFGHGLVLVNGRPCNVYAYELPAQNLEVEASHGVQWGTAQNWINNQVCATNASFFGHGPGNLTAFHINHGDLSLRQRFPNGTVNAGAWNLRMGAMFLPSNSTNVLKAEFADNSYRCDGDFHEDNHYHLPNTQRRVSRYPNQDCFPIRHGNARYNLSDLRWAIGGDDLFLDENISSGEFDGRLRTAEQNMVRAEVPRTLIGRVGTNRIVLVVVFGETVASPRANGVLYARNNNGITPWEARNMLRDTFNCNIGMMVDGGSSSQISFRDSAGNWRYAGTQNVWQGQSGLGSVPTRMRISGI